MSRFKFILHRKVHRVISIILLSNSVAALIILLALENKDVLWTNSLGLQRKSSDKSLM